MKVPWLSRLGEKLLRTQGEEGKAKDDMNFSSLETWGDEFVEGNIESAPCRLVRPVRVAKSPVSFECCVHTILRVPNESHGEGMFGAHLVGTSDIVIGRVLGFMLRGSILMGMV